jgi:hypothetical protein
VTVSANLTDGTGATYRTAYLHFQLLNCGDNFPAVPSQPGMIVQDSFDIHPTLTTGLVAGSIIGNDQILCGNVASTWYQVTPMKDSSHPLRNGQPYVICASLSGSASCYPGTGETWNPLLAMPMTTPPPAPGFLAVYENPTLGQFISQPGGTSLVFQGLGSWIACGGGGRQVLTFVSGSWTPSTASGPSVNNVQSATAPVVWNNGTNPITINNTLTSAGLPSALTLASPFERLTLQSAGAGNSFASELQFLRTEGTIASPAACATNDEMAITGSPITASGTFNLAFTGTNGDVMKFGASNAPTDSGVLLASLAPLASPALTGNPTAPTRSGGDNSTKLATTAYADTMGALKLNINNSAPTGLFDASATTQLKLPVHAAFATLANGEIGFDSTNKNVHIWQNAADYLLFGGLTSGTFVNGDCAQISLSSSFLSLIDAGGACGTSSMVYPSGSGIPVVLTGTSWATTLTETDNNMLAGVSGAWTKVTALPNGITATTQTLLSADTKVATDNYVDQHFIASGSTALPTTSIPSGTCGCHGDRALIPALASRWAYRLAVGRSGDCRPPHSLQAVTREKTIAKPLYGHVARYVAT